MIYGKMPVNVQRPIAVAHHGADQGASHIDVLLDGPKSSGPGKFPQGSAGEVPQGEIELWGYVTLRAVT